MRVLVCGGRDYINWRHVCRTLDDLHHDRGPIAVIINGGATGADAGASKWAGGTSTPLERYRPDWDAHGKAAGPIRNQRMIDEGKPDLVVAFPGGRGTKDMVSRARKAGIEVMEIEE